MRVACAGADAVLHLAARPGVRESLLDPETTLVQNVLGTSAVLEAIRAEGVPTLVFASSSSVYGARRGESLSEGDAADRPASPYGASKRAAELLCYAAHATWGVNVTAARLFTVYGPRQRPGMAIARFCRQIRAGEPITLYGDGTSARDYTFVEDAAAGLLAALHRTEGYRVLNLAGGHSVTLAALVTTLGEVLGLPVRTERLPDQAGDVPETRADLTAAAQWLGWSPRVDLRAVLTRYVNWLDAGQP
jgi:UDP-glucuronate 4-epimerase